MMYTRRSSYNILGRSNIYRSRTGAKRRSKIDAKFRTHPLVAGYFSHVQILLNITNFIDIKIFVLKSLRSYSKLLSKLGATPFQEYVTK